LATILLCHLRSLKQQHEKLSALVLESCVAMFAGALMGAGGGRPHQVLFCYTFTRVDNSLQLLNK
jgi:hypothetical protein